jgi:Uma2 family endonuclease
MTAAQFDALPEEAGRRWELLDREIIEVPNATARHDDVEAELLFSLMLFIGPRKLGKVIPDTEFAFGESRLRPGLSILSQSKWAELDRDKVPVRTIPDITVEIVSPSEGCRQTRTQGCRLHRDRRGGSLGDPYHAEADVRPHHRLRP